MKIVLDKSRTHTAVVLNDIHIPFQNKTLVELLLKFIKDTKPDIIILGGDIIDCYEISDFSKSAWMQKSFQNECEEAKGFLKTLRGAAGGAKIIYIWGNHEFRIQRYISRNAKELAFLDSLKLENMLGLQELDIIAVPTRKELSKFSDTYIHIRDLYIGHFDRANKHSGYTAKNLLEDKGVSLIQGHTHRGGMTYKTLVDGTILTAVENYCLCDTQPVFLNSPNWQNGFSVVTFSDITQIYPILIKKNTFYYNGKRYTKN